MRESARAPPPTIPRGGPRHELCPHELGTHELATHELRWLLGRLSQRVLARHVSPCSRRSAGHAGHARHLSRSTKARRRGGRGEPSAARWRVRHHSPARASRAFGPGARLDASRYGGLDDGAVRQLASRDCPGAHCCVDAQQRSARGPRRRHHRHRGARRLGPPGPSRRASLAHGSAYSRGSAYAAMFALGATFGARGGADSGPWCSTSFWRGPARSRPCWCRTRTRVTCSAESHRCSSRNRSAWSRSWF